MKRFKRIGWTWRALDNVTGGELCSQEQRSRCEREERCLNDKRTVTREHWAFNHCSLIVIEGREAEPWEKLENIHKWKESER